MKKPVNATIKIVQQTKGRWQIETQHGYVLQDNIQLPSTSAAEEYVKNYLSSFHCWSHEVVPLKKKGSK